jgi:hypothetical protein
MKIYIRSCILLYKPEFSSVAPLIYLIYRIEIFYNQLDAQIFFIQQ